MEEALSTLIGWAYPAVGLAILIVACTRPRLPGRAPLLGFLIINLVVMVFWRVIDLLATCDLIDSSTLMQIYRQGGSLVGAVGLVGFCLLIPYLLYAGQAGARDSGTSPYGTCGERAPMTIARALFSFSGRMCRSDYWLKGFLIMLPIGIFNNILVYGVGTEGAFAVATVIGVLSIWPSYAIIVKRLHDRDHSGWFVLTLFIPLANLVFCIWILIEVWFMKGTDGPNRFGLDPLGPPDAPLGGELREDPPVVPSL
jgi:uncharacterized membrane protein YhaH (DUF805 family)